MCILEIERALNNVVGIIYGFPRRRIADLFHFSRWISSLCDGVKDLKYARNTAKLFRFKIFYQRRPEH